MDKKTKKISNGVEKKLLKELKQKLEEEKTATKEQLKKFAKEDTKLKGDWDTRFPKFDGGESGGAALEKAADEVEEYVTLLPIEHSLEVRLKNLNLALEKIERKKYGICEKCGREIETKRLKICPEAKFCLKCTQK